LDNLDCSPSVVFGGGLSATVASGSSPRRDFCFLFLFFLLVVCTHDVFVHFVGAEARSNWYLHDIIIFPLSKKS
jgi:hypothetical protein